MQIFINMEYPYKQFYCEENIYKFLQLTKDDVYESYALFVTNENKNILVENHQFDGWDYHVIGLIKNKKDDGYTIIDFDSNLGREQEFISYIEKHFTDEESNPQFRVVPYDILMDKFKTDRSHMTIEELGTPAWDKLHNETNLFTHFLNLQKDIEGTSLYNKKELIHTYGK